MSGHEYNTALQAHIERELIQNNRRYDRFDIAAEIVQQAIRVPSYAMVAIAWKTRLTEHLGQRHLIPTIYEANNLINMLDSDRTNLPTSRMEPMIRKTTAPQGRKPFQYRNLL